MYKIGTIPGDGTGPEVTDEAMKVLQAVAEKNGIDYEVVEYDIGGERYKRTGRDPARLRPRRAWHHGRGLPRRHRPPGRQARHP